MMKTKVSWAFVFALMQVILKRGSLIGLVVSALFVVGMLLLYNEKEGGKTILAVGSFAFVGNLAWSVVGSGLYSRYISTAINEGIAWYVIFIIIPIAVLAVQYIQLGMCMLKGNAPKKSVARKIFGGIFVFCTVLNLICGIMFNGWVYSLSLAVSDAIAFVLAVSISKDVITKEQPRKHSLVKAAILAVILGLVINLAPGAFAGGGGSSSSSNEPWKDLGVSKKEYMEIYNFYKYGVNFD